MKFILTGTYRGRHAFKVLIDRNGMIEKHKVHLEGNKVIDPSEIDITVTDNGTVKRIQIDEADLIKQLQDIQKASPSFVKFLKETPKK